MRLPSPTNVGNLVKAIAIDSPFKNTMAYIRWNSHHPERLPLITLGYTSFFDTVHISMPPLNSSSNTNIQNLTYDEFRDSYTIYHSVRDTMSRILENPNMENIDGLMFYHFDVWIDPLRFAEMDRNKIWFPNSPDPKWECMKTTERYGDWWGWEQGYHKEAIQGLKIASHLQGKYDIDPDEWCIG
jgi:hypothetical protein